MIQFYLCKTAEQYLLCQKLQKRVEGHSDPLGFPTVYGVSPEGRIIGFTSTSTEYGVVISGPTVIDPYFTPRLKYGQEQIKAHESALRSFGVTEYLFSVRKDNTKMLQAVSELTAYDEDEDCYWYKRTI